jgi:hypothetical protein
MNRALRSTRSKYPSNCFVALLWFFGIVGSPALAQTAGLPAVVSSAGTLTSSNAYIDASAYCTVKGSCSSSDDFCAVLSSAFGNLPHAGGVVDARGVKGTSTSSCSSNPFTSYPSTVLLPPGQISINAPWILQSGTRLIGEGGEDPGQNPSLEQRTVIQSQSAGFPGSNSYIIQMGTGSGTCAGVSIEDLVVDDNGLSTPNAISNANCGNQSYVKGVTLYRVLGTGLNVTSDAGGSGPYVNITFDTLGLTNTSSSTTGIYLGAATSGFRGVLCTDSVTGTSYNAIPGTCVSVHASGNALQDVRIEGLKLGIDVNASNTTLLNVDGDTTPIKTLWTVNVVQIEQGVQDVAVIGVSNSCISPSTICVVDQLEVCRSGAQVCSESDYTIYDNSASAPPPITAANDQYVAMYAIGDPITVGGGTAYSRYTTSPHAANWSTGAGSILSNSCTTPGSLYSNTNGLSPGLLVCSAVTTTGSPATPNPIWVTVK